MPHAIEFDPAALIEWHALDRSVREVFVKQLKKRATNPHIPSARLSGPLHHCYRIKLKKSGHRLIYTVIDEKLVILIVALGKRERGRVYEQAINRVLGGSDF